MTQAFICDAIRTPFGRYGGALSSVRTDDLGAIPLKALMARNPNVDWAAVVDVLYGCANQVEKIYAGAAPRQAVPGANRGDNMVAGSPYQDAAPRSGSAFGAAANKVGA